MNCNIICASKYLVQIYNTKCLFSMSKTCSLNQKYRKEHGLPLNPNLYGPLTDLPDFTYLDGKPTPYGSNLKKRIMKQQNLAQQILILSGELDFAKDRFQNSVGAEEDTKKNILANKLKPKGHLLLTTK